MAKFLMIKNRARLVLFGLYHHICCITLLIKLHWVPLPAPGPPSTNITFGRGKLFQSYILQLLKNLYVNENPWIFDNNTRQ